MRVLGIDPGPRGFAWAIYDESTNTITQWGNNMVTAAYDVVAIEDMVGIYMPGKDRASTAKMIGRLQERFPGALLVPREAIRSVLTGSARGDEVRANRALGRFIPSFAARRPGLNGHHRAAACCAFVALGRSNKQRIMEEAR